MKFKTYGVCFIAFGVLSLITAYILSFTSGKDIVSNFPASGGQLGPIVTQSSNDVFKIELTQYVPDREWSAVEAEVVDSAGNYIFSFSDELWFETGYDSEGRWEEGKNNFDISITFPDPGTYFINFSSESSNVSQIGNINAVASKKLGSSVAYIWLAVFSLGLGILIVFFSPR